MGDSLAGDDIIPGIGGAAAAPSLAAFEMDPSVPGTTALQAATAALVCCLAGVLLLREAQQGQAAAGGDVDFMAVTP